MLLERARCDLHLRWWRPSTKIPNVLRSVKEVQSFVGMMQYFALYIPMMAQFRSKLTDLTKKDVVFKFTAEHEEAVKSLKHLLKQAMVYIVD